MVIPRLTGKSVILTPLVTDEKAIEKYTQWISDEEIAQWVDKSNSVLNIVDETKWATTPNGEIRFSIFADTDIILGDETSFSDILHIYTEEPSYKAGKCRTMIGTCSITMSKCNTNATLGILIGEEIARGLGFGTETIRLLTEFAFNQLRAHRCHLVVVADNEKALKCYKKVGYEICGTEHEAFWYDGRYADVLHLEKINKN